MRSIVPLTLALLVSPSSNPAAELSSSQGRVFSSVDLGFRFTPPPGLRDLTAALKERERRRTPDGRTHFAMLLWMASGPDDTAEDWVALGVETYPRGRDKDRGDDLTASFTTNVSALPGSTTERLVIKLSGKDFAVSRVERKEPLLTKYGVVYTTVRKEQFVTFLFGGNDRNRVEKLAGSMKTLEFAP
jgi:hypothetical protein